MIELNLLPDELRIKERKSFQLAAFPIIPTFLGILGALVITHILLVFFIGVNKITLTNLKREWENFSPKRKEIDALKNEVKNINTKVKAIEELTQERTQWAKKLNSLSDSMPANIWLSGLSYDKKSVIPTFVLEGFATGTEEDVGKFMRALKDNKEFFADLQSIELGFTKVSLIDKQEVTNFRLIGTFRKQRED